MLATCAFSFLPMFCEQSTIFLLYCDSSSISACRPTFVLRSSSHFSLRGSWFWPRLLSLQAQPATRRSHRIRSHQPGFLEHIDTALHLYHTAYTAYLSHQGSDETPQGLSERDATGNDDKQQLRGFSIPAPRKILDVLQ